MQFVLTPAQMRAVDALATSMAGIPPLLLMENAGRSAAEHIITIARERGLTRPHVLLCCAGGNNGGDGFVIARHLVTFATIHVLWIGDIAKMSTETRTNFDILEKLSGIIGFDVQHEVSEDDDCSIPIGKPDIIIDALLGVGGSESPRGLVLPLLQRLKPLSALRVAIDIPTGLHSATGIAHPNTFKADYTITMAALKTGLLLHQGIEYSGKIIVADIGIPDALIAQRSSVSVLTDTDCRNILPARAKTATKHDMGSVAVIGGSASMPGAATLTANACLRAGAGIVRLYIPTIHSALRPEIMPFALPSTHQGTIAASAREIFRKLPEQHDVLIVGPGLGNNPETLELCREFLLDALKSYPDLRLVLDADVLRCFLPDDQFHHRVIITPHQREFAKLTGLTTDEVRRHAATLAVEWAARLQCVVVLKNVPTIISDGHHSYWNCTGNPGMATAGSGDVLAGIIGAFAARGIALAEAAALGVYIHARAGDQYAARYNQESLTASDLIEGLETALIL